MFIHSFFQLVKAPEKLRIRSALEYYEDYFIHYFHSYKGCTSQRHVEFQLWPFPWWQRNFSKEVKLTRCWFVYNDEIYIFMTQFPNFQIMPRAQNAHAYVNAGFLFQLRKSDNGKILRKPTIVYGGINPYFVSISKKCA